MLFPFWIAAIVALNIWDDASKGRPFNFTHLLMAGGMILFAGVVLIFCRLIFKFVDAYVSHKDGER